MRYTLYEIVVKAYENNVANILWLNAGLFFIGWWYDVRPTNSNLLRIDWKRCIFWHFLIALFVTQLVVFLTIFLFTKISTGFEFSIFDSTVVEIKDFESFHNSEDMFAMYKAMESYSRIRKNNLRSLFPVFIIKIFFVGQKVLKFHENFQNSFKWEVKDYELLIIWNMFPILCWNLLRAGTKRKYKYQMENIC